MGQCLYFRLKHWPCAIHASISTCVCATHTHTHFTHTSRTCLGQGNFNQRNLPVFGLWDETGENPGWQGRSSKKCAEIHTSRSTSVSLLPPKDVQDNQSRYPSASRSLWSRFEAATPVMQQLCSSFYTLLSCNRGNNEQQTPLKRPPQAARAATPLACPSPLSPSPSKPFQHEAMKSVSNQLAE